MTGVDDEAAFERRFARVEPLLAELAQSSDPLVAQATREILATVLELHQRGLARTLELAARENGVREALAADPRVSAMLLLHGLHPVALNERLARTVATLRERFRTKIEDIECDASDTEVVVRVLPAASACGSTREALKKDFEAALIAAAPDAHSLRVELLEPASALIQLRLPSRAGGAHALGESR
ncbi:MAG TPA: hypothetical protein VNW92_19750 [Polyangiaceae bacterium]|nr:hypothetical protein [Polyangiaceae bacterium]